MGALRKATATLGQVTSDGCTVGTGCNQDTLVSPQVYSLVIFLIVVNCHQLQA